MRALLPPILAAMLGGCQAFFPPGGLPAVPYHQLPSAVAELRALADSLVGRSRDTRDLVRARSALRKADFVERDEYETLWRLGRVAGILARLDTDRGEQWAQEGHMAAARARSLAAERPEGHLYFAVCSGLLAKYLPSKADELLSALIAAAKRANELAPHFGAGEARRTLGATYTYAPPWPSGPGDLDEAIEILEGLVADHPEEPMNVFFLAEAYRKADQRKDAIRLYVRVRQYKPSGVWRSEGPPYRQQARDYIRQLRRSP